MAGNTVILKPAPEAVLTSWALCKALWDAGIPKNVLQFLPTTDDAVGRSLVTDDRVDAVILTGAYATGRMFKSWKPGLRLLAETSGKNSMIVTAMADHDQAIKDMVKSAFGHAGQKCSAASLAVLEAEVYDNEAFLKQLRDAAASLNVGPAHDLRNTVTTVVREPGDDLRRGLTQLDPGEFWLLEPRVLNGNSNLWSPGIKLGVKRGSWYHRTECFGPVLGLMRAENLDDAIDCVNDSEFGLTSGIQSLDDREVAIWRERVEAGNAYINRGITGAIVQRQPFGGWKKSVFGSAKAGGPNYVAALCRWREEGLPTLLAQAEGDVQVRIHEITDWLAANGGLAQIERVFAGAGSYAHAWREHFSVEHDPSRVLGESNVFRYRPILNVLIRVARKTELTDALIAVLAAQTCGVSATLSVCQGIGWPIECADGVTEDDSAFVERLADFERVRAFSPLSQSAQVSATAAHTLIVEQPLLLTGRLELRHYLREQTVTQTTHRYGNLIVTPQAHPVSERR